MRTPLEMVARCLGAGALLALLGGGCGSSRASLPTPPPVSTSPGTSGPAAAVNVFIGTAPASVPVPVPDGAAGATFPGAAAPFGMVQWSPDTPGASPPGYAYADTSITGFSLTHLSGAGCPAMRDFPVLPVAGSWDASSDPTDTFTHAREIASPGFYEVSLGSGIRVDLTATQRTGYARFTFPSGPTGTVLIAGSLRHDSLYVNGAALQLGADGTLTGQRTNTFFCGSGASYPVYLAARFGRPPSATGAFADAARQPGATKVTGNDAGLYLTFDTSSDRAVEMKIGLSYVSVAGALANLDAESPGWSFDAAHQQTVARWNAALGRVAATGGTAAQRTQLYTALYHALLQPAVASDASGDFMGLDGQKKNAGYVRYQNFSGWDIERSWVQLAAVVAPDQAGDILRSYVDAGTECGLLPRWPLANTEAAQMIGDPGPSIVASAYAFGVRGFDAQAALRMMIRAATDPTATCNGNRTRPGLADDLASHYLPIDAPDAPSGTVSTTLEYAAADFAIAQLAGALGDAADHDAFLARSSYWRNLLDPTCTSGAATGYLQPRYAADAAGAPAFRSVDVTTHPALDVQGADGFIEGNATQYTLSVAHDLPGLIAGLGGEANLVARLDALFGQVNAGLSQPYFYIGNEPGSVSPWAYDFAGAPWRTQAVVQQVLAGGFSEQPDGLPGNDDLGAISAWEVWAMLGMYPAMPGVGGVVLASPTFPEVDLTLAGGATLRITAQGGGAGAGSPYVQSLAVNGQPATSTWLPWSALAGGGTLAFVLGPAPNRAWGAGAGDRPPAGG